MSFKIVSEIIDGKPGSFSAERRVFFNQCGLMYYCGSLKFSDSKHREREIPIFNDDCLEEKTNTHRLLKRIRKELKVSCDHFYVSGIKSRSIHQNEHGYLPYKDDGGDNRFGVSAPAIAITAQLFGGLPNNQAKLGAGTKGQFLEYTCDDSMHVDCRLIVDYRFGFIYMTFGHYHEDSFALLIRSDAELRFELQPVLPVLNATYID